MADELTSPCLSCTTSDMRLGEAYMGEYSLLKSLSYRHHEVACIYSHEVVAFMKLYQYTD